MLKGKKKHGKINGYKNDQDRTIYLETRDRI